MTKPHKIILETIRLILRLQIMNDLDGPRALYCNPEITKYIPDAPRSYEEAKDDLEWFVNGHPGFHEVGLGAIIHKETGKIVCQRLSNPCFLVCLPMKSNCQVARNNVCAKV